MLSFNIIFINISILDIKWKTWHATFFKNIKAIQDIIVHGN